MENARTQQKEQEKKLCECKKKIEALKIEHQELDAKRESMEKEKESLNKSDAVALKRREAELITELNGQQKNLMEKQRFLEQKQTQYQDAQNQIKTEEDRKYEKEKELEEWLSYMAETPTMNEELTAYIEKEQKELTGEFCRGCGYCMPCPAGIMINQCARMSLMLRRAPSKAWLTPQMQAEMKKIEVCLHCNQCMKKCPYELNTPELLKKNYEDYKKVLAGEVKVQ